MDWAIIITQSYRPCVPNKRL